MNHTHHRPNTIDRSTCRSHGNGVSTIERSVGAMHHRGHYTVDRAAGRRPYNNSNPGGVSSNLTAAEVANLLRSSIRRGAQAAPALRRSFHQEQVRNTAQEPQGAASVENLVEAAAPIGQEPAAATVTVTVVDEPVKKTADEMDSSVSVI